MITTILIAFLSAYFGALIALQKFKKEKVWQEKFDAYKIILKSIHSMKHWADETWQGGHNLPTLGHEDGGHFNKHRIVLAEYINIGELIISEKSISLLKDFEQEIFDSDMKLDELNSGDNQELYEHIVEYSDKTLKIISQYLPQIINESKKDLK